MKIRITACDIAVKQKSTDIIDLAKGKREYTLYFFKNPVLVKTKIGLHDVTAGDCILIAPGFPVITSKVKANNGIMIRLHLKDPMPHV